MIAAAVETVELLHFAPENTHAQRMFAALAPAAGHQAFSLSESRHYRGESDLLLLWGPGHPSRFEAMRAHVAKGGHVLAFDGAYWHRAAKYRVSIDAAHPQAWVMARHWPTARFEADRVRVDRCWDPDGPIVIAGLGEKAKLQYGQQVADWEAAIVRACQERYPRTILYRRKRGVGIGPDGVRYTSDGPIEQVLDGASLVITWHSNVAVDAIRLGIPVVCRDGAAAAVCPSDLPAFGALQPLDRSTRDRFLANLAWFQWAPSEAEGFWAWVREVLACA